MKNTAKLNMYAEYLIELGWRYIQGDQTDEHRVLAKERLIQGTFNYIALRIVGRYVMVAIAIKGEHAFQADIRNFKHFVSIIQEWGGK